METNIASPSDISYDLAYSAYRNTSFSPDKRAESEMKSYAEDVNGFYAEMLPLAVTDAQKAILAFEMDRYRTGYLKHVRAYLSSKANTASPMITGPARFPVARNQKRMQWADNKVAAFLAWRDKARAAIKARILDARPADEKQAEEIARVCKGIASSLRTIEAIDAGTERGASRALFVSSIYQRTQTIARNGNSAELNAIKALVTEYNATHKKPAISERHKFWLLEIARTVPQSTAVTYELDGITITDNVEADRIQITFPGKPDEEMRSRLRSSGWKWSPSNGVWQRQRTDNARQSAWFIINRR